MNILYPVFIKKQFSEQFQTSTEFASGWKSVLSKARANRLSVKCCCPGTGEKQLAVRYYEDSDSYSLARYPFTGAEHANDCRFYAPNSIKSGLSCYSDEVVKVSTDGQVKIRLEIGLKKRQPGAETVVKPESKSHGRRNTQTTMRLLGLLHYLWDSANLNVWWPAMEGKRNLHVINSKLVQAASCITASGIHLDSVLVLSALPTHERTIEANKKRFANARDSQHRLVLVAPLASFDPERPNDRLAIVGFGGVPFLDISPATWNRACQRFDRAVALWKKKERVIVIAEIEPKENERYAKVLDLALMPVTSTWIPVDSSYELMIADKLTAEKRAVFKPLRFDAEEDAVFPDFILRDTGRDTPLEVFGRSDETYDQRKAEKEAYYRERFGLDGWWCWNAANDPQGKDIPSFPPKIRS